MQEQVINKPVRLRLLCFNPNGSFIIIPTVKKVGDKFTLFFLNDSYLKKEIFDEGVKNLPISILSPVTLNYRNNVKGFCLAFVLPDNNKLYLTNSTLEYELNNEVRNEFYRGRKQKLQILDYDINKAVNIFPKIVHNDYYKNTGMHLANQKGDVLTAFELGASCFLPVSDRITNAESYAGLQIFQSPGDERYMPGKREVTLSILHDEEPNYLRYKNKKPDVSKNYDTSFIWTMESDPSIIDSINGCVLSNSGKYLTYGGMTENIAKALRVLPIGIRNGKIGFRILRLNDHLENYTNETPQFLYVDVYCTEDRYRKTYHFDVRSMYERYDLQPGISFVLGYHKYQQKAAKKRNLTEKVYLPLHEGERRVKFPFRFTLGAFDKVTKG